MTTSPPVTPSKRRSPQPPLSPADEARYHLGMVRFMAERGSLMLAESHMIGYLDARDAIVPL